MIEKNEHLSPHERLSEKRVPGAARTEELTVEQTERVMLARKKLLFTLRGDIGTSLYDALDAKLKHETAEFEKLMRRNAEVVETYKKLNKVLRSEYFVQRPLDTHLI